MHTLTEIRALAVRLLEMEAKATKAPWHEHDSWIGERLVTGFPCVSALSGFHVRISLPEDRAFLVSTRNALRPLCLGLIALMDAVEYGNTEDFPRDSNPGDVILARASELVREREGEEKRG